MRHSERHRTEQIGSDRIGWLRAAVLGANDGIVSTASLILGVAAAGADSKAVLVTGVAPALCQWQRVSTCQSALKQTPREPTLPGREPNWQMRLHKSMRNLPRFT